MTFHDKVYGEYSYNFENDGDLLIIKSDGYPSYHFANVVDDRHMQISHVLRGEEWLNSTPKHLALYEAFGWTPPVFGHLPLLQGSQGVKLSKRENSAFVEYYKKLGYYPLALINSVCSTGGGFKVSFSTVQSKTQNNTQRHKTKLFNTQRTKTHNTHKPGQWVYIGTNRVPPNRHPVLP